MGNKPPSAIEETGSAETSTEKSEISPTPSALKFDFVRPLTQFQISELKNEFQRLTRVEQEAELFKAEIFHLKAEFEASFRGLDESSLRRETVTLKESLGQLKQEFSNLDERERKCAIIERTFSSWKDDLDEKTNELEQLKESSAAEITVLRSQVTKLSEAAFNANQTERELKAMSALVEQLRAENIKLAEDTVDNKTPSDKEQELIVSTTEIKVLKDLLETFMGDISRYKMDLEAAKETEKSLLEQLSAANTDFQAAVFEIAQLKLKNSMDSDKLELLTQENLVLKEEIESQKDSLQNQSTSATPEDILLSNLLREKEKEIMELKTNLKSLENQNNSSNSSFQVEVLNLQAKLITSEESRMKLSAEVVHLRETVEKDRFEIEMLKSSVASANGMAESYKADITRLTAQFESSKDSVGAVQQAQLELGRLQKVEKILEKKIIRLQKENETLVESTRALEPLKDDLAKAKEEAARNEAKVRDLLEELETAEMSVRNLEAELSLSRKQTDSGQGEEERDESHEEVSAGSHLDSVDESSAEV